MGTRKLGPPYNFPSVVCLIMNIAATANSYDQAPYPSRPFAETHPDRLATIGMLFGMEIQPIQHCRVLEIGCACGGNLIPMAEQLPGSQFLGIDLSGVQIAEAQKLSNDAGVKNAQFLCMDIRDLNASFGEFDYIICHGVFSWVSRPVQDRILEICGSRLMPQGVAYVSYNTFPGWHTRGMLRDMMYYHASRFSDPRARVQEARGMLEFLIQGTPGDSLYGALLRSESNLLRDKEDGYLLHDDLEEINIPSYFAQFAARAQAQGLQYLAEADLSTMWSRHMPPDVVAALERMTSDLIQREQYMDFLRNRDFRKTLLCHREICIDRELRPDGLGHFHIAAPVAVMEQSIDFHNSSSIRFLHFPSKQELVATTPLWKGAMACLAEAWPGNIPFSQLASMARVRAGMEEVTDNNCLHSEDCILGKSILEMHLCGLAELHATPSCFCLQPGERPVASRLARVQAASGNRVTSLRHEVVVVEDLARQLLPHLNGSNDRSELQSIANRVVDDRVVAARTGSRPGEEIQDPVARHNGSFDATLQALARAALLTG